MVSLIVTRLWMLAELVGVVGVAMGLSWKRKKKDRGHSLALDTIKEMFLECKLSYILLSRGLLYI